MKFFLSFFSLQRKISLKNILKLFLSLIWSSLNLVQVMISSRALKRRWIDSISIFIFCIETMWIFTQTMLWKIWRKVYKKFLIELNLTFSLKNPPILSNKKLKCGKIRRFWAMFVYIFEWEMFFLLKGTIYQWSIQSKKKFENYLFFEKDHFIFFEGWKKLFLIIFPSFPLGNE